MPAVGLSLNQPYALTGSAVAINAAQAIAVADTPITRLPTRNASASEAVAVSDGALSNASAVGNYAGRILADTPSAYWRLGEAAGSVAYDSSGHGLDGVYRSGFTLGAAGALVGDLDAAASFTGASNAQVDGLAASALALSTGTVEAWIKTSSAGATKGIAVKLNAYGLFLNNAGHLDGWDWTGGVFLQTGTSGATGSLGPAINDGAWHHVAMTFQSGVVGATVLYVDGQPIAGLAHPTITVTSQATDFQIASGHLAGQNLAATFDEVAVYDHVLSPAQVQAHYAVGAALHLVYVVEPVAVTEATTVPGYRRLVLSDTPTAYYRLDEASGASADDSSGLGNGAAITGTPAYAQPGLLSGDPDTAMGFAPGSYLASSSAALVDAAHAGSVEAWVYYSANPANNLGFVSAAQGQGASTYLASLYVSSGGVPGFYFYGSVQHQKYAVGSAIAPGLHHLVGTWDGSNIRLYVDGVQVGSAGCDLWTSQLNLLVNFASQVGNTPTLIAGTFTADEVAYYAYALSAGQVRAHYAGGTLPRLVQITQPVTVADNASRRIPSIGTPARVLGTPTLSTAVIARPAGQARLRVLGSLAAVRRAAISLVHSRAQGIPVLSGRVLPSGLARVRVSAAPSVNRRLLTLDGLSRLTSQTPLTFAPPELVNPVDVTMDSNNRRMFLDVNTDYRIHLPTDVAVNPPSGDCQIVGGRNVVLLGGEIRYQYTDPLALQRGLFIKGDSAQTQPRTVHIEGLLLGGQLYEGFDVDSSGETGLTVQLCNIRIDSHLVGSFEGAHADSLQCWNGPYQLNIDGFSAPLCDYQGMMLQPAQFGTRDGPWTSFGTWQLRRVNVATLGGMCFTNSSRPPATPVLDIVGTDVWGTADTPPDPGKLMTPAGALVGATFGVPPGGDFVPDGFAGRGYVSPGYA